MRPTLFIFTHNILLRKPENQDIINEDAPGDKIEKMPKNLLLSTIGTTLSISGIKV